MYGSPVYPILQEQTGSWLMTVHSELKPHCPKQGSMHFLALQAKSLLQSASMIHSGEHKKLGCPEKPGEHLQTGLPLNIVQKAFCPHCLFSHVGSVLSVGFSAERNKKTFKLPDMQTNYKIK